jgi:hypothetical protein
MLRIGIDFDNTIACYDNAFAAVAALMGLMPLGKTGTKAEIKQELLGRTGGDLEWQRLQGQVYGKHMHRALVFPGLFEFLALCYLRGYEVFIVSHKTEYGHFDEERVSLRGQAMRWLEANGFFDNSAFGLDSGRVFFETTREAKLARIQALGCTDFVDDLIEVFDEPNFPANVTPYLFRPTGGSPVSPSVRECHSWRDVSTRLLGGWQECDVCRLAKLRFPDLKIDQVQLMKGRGNSRVYQLSGIDNVSYCLKVYPDRQQDPRPRLEIESSACRALADRSYPVAASICADDKLGWGLFRWIDGPPVGTPDSSFVDAALAFVRRIYGDESLRQALSGFANASESCLCGHDILIQIDRRIERLRAAGHDELTAFIENHFLGVYLEMANRVRYMESDLVETVLPRSFQILSPSDFGSHNALRGPDGQPVFIDFEYFGWDDPVKLVSDFYWHPGMALASSLRQKWLEQASIIFRSDETFDIRLQSYLPLFGLRWCLIVLNEFLRSEALRRQHAAGQPTESLSEIQTRQLLKAQNLLTEIRGVVSGNG